MYLAARKIKPAGKSKLEAEKCQGRIKFSMEKFYSLKDDIHDIRELLFFPLSFNCKNSAESRKMLVRNG